MVSSKAQDLWLIRKLVRRMKDSKLKISDSQIFENAANPLDVEIFDSFYLVDI